MSHVALLERQKAPKRGAQIRIARQSAQQGVVEVPGKEAPVSVCPTPLPRQPPESGTETGEHPTFGCQLLRHCFVSRIEDRQAMVRCAQEPENRPAIPLPAPVAGTPRKVPACPHESFDSDIGDRVGE